MRGRKALPLLPDGYGRASCAHRSRRSAGCSTAPPGRCGRRAHRLASTQCKTPDADERLEEERGTSMRRPTRPTESKRQPAHHGRGGRDGRTHRRRWRTEAAASSPKGAGGVDRGPTLVGTRTSTGGGGVARDRREVRSQGRPKLCSETGTPGAGVDGSEHCTGTALVLHSCCTGAIVLLGGCCTNTHWHCACNALALYRYCVGAALVLRWQCTYIELVLTDTAHGLHRRCCCTSAATSEC